MANRNPTYTPEIAETIDYKPLSLVAVAGIVLAGLYVGLLLIGVVAAQVKGEPFFEPFFFGSWGIALALGAAVLSGLGLWQISNSNGTLAGTALAKWGLGISLIAGASYFTYQFFTQLAILQQANRFLLEKDEASGFFPRLQGNDVDLRTAYLYTLGTADRSVRPDNPDVINQLDRPTGQNPRGLWTQFLESPLVRAIRVAAPGTVKVEPLAVQSWSYDNRAYSITRVYKITTDEAVYEVPLTVVSIEPIGEGEKRKWKIDWQPLFTSKLQPLSQTELGKKRIALRQRAFEFLGDTDNGWLSKLTHRDALELYLGTRPASERAELRAKAAAIHEGTPLVALTGAAVPPLGSQTEEQMRRRWLPDYWPLAVFADYCKVEKMRSFDPNFLNRAKLAARLALAADRLPYLAPRVMGDEHAPCTINGKDGEVQVAFQIEIVPSPLGQRVWADTLLVLKVIAAAPAGLDPTAPGAEQQWRVKSIEFDRALPIPQPKG